MEFKDKVARYAELKLLIKNLEAETDELRPAIVSHMQASEAEEMNTDFGKFILSKRRTWTYPEDVLALEQTFKKAKKGAEGLGTATYVENPVLMFKVVGEE